MENFHSKKFIYSFLCVSIICVYLLSRIMTWNEMREKNIDINNIQQINSEQGAILELEKIYYNEISSHKYEITVEGWSIVQGIDIESAAIHVLLQNINDGKTYILPTSMIVRTDVTEAYSDEHDYNNSGFKVNFISKKFNFQKDDYKVMILYELNNDVYVISSNTSIPRVEAD